MQELEDEFFALNQKHKILDYLEAKSQDIETAIKERESQGLGRSTH